VADHYEMTGRDDQRSQARKPTRISAWADPGGQSAAIDCLIIDLSEDGAQLVSVTGAPFPDRFTLQVAKCEIAKASVVWRTERSVGVKFLTLNAA
jgi:PilZ domain